MSQFASVLFLAFLFKFSAIGCATYLIEKKFRNILGSIVGAYCLVQIFLIAQMLFLSIFHALTVYGIWAGLSLLNVFLVFAVVYSKKDNVFVLRPSTYKIFLSSSALLALLSILAIFSFQAYHSLYFFDNTWDASTYELARIFFYAHEKSVFFIQPTLAVNIFCNEWNGELNSLFYVLATNNDQGSSFGNVDAWLFLCLSYAWLMNVLTVPSRLQLLGGLILGSAPVWLGLAFTVKGNLFSGAFVAAGFAFVWYTHRAKNIALNYIFSFAALALASGSKGTALPLAALFTIQIIISIFYHYKKNLPKLILLFIGVIIFLIGDARYVLNIFDYATPFKHIEPTIFLLSHVSDNLVGILHALLEPFEPHSFIFFATEALMMKFGFLFVALLVWIIFTILLKCKNPCVREYKSKKEYIWEKMTLVLFVISILVLLTELYWIPWGFTYFAPFVFIFLAFLFSGTARYFKVKWTILISIIWILVVCIDFFGSFWQLGQTTPVLFREAVGQSQMERKLAARLNIWYGKDGLSALNFNDKKISDIIIFNNADAAVAQFFGENHKNNVTLVKNLNELKKKTALKNYDIVAITPGCTIPPAPPSLNCSTLPPDLLGYVVKINTPVWTLFVPVEQKESA